MKALDTKNLQVISGGGFFGSGSSRSSTSPNNINLGYQPANGLGGSIGTAWQGKNSIQNAGLTINTTNGNNSWSFGVGSVFGKGISSQPNAGFSFSRKW